MKPKTQKSAGQPRFIHPLSLAGIAIVTLLVYSGSLSNGILNWDDNKYLLENPYLHDLSFNGIRAIFSSFYMGNYHPLTSLSWSIEYALAGFNSKVFHVTNLLLHTANAILVFYLVKRLLKDHWAGVLASLLFALHPMHVESVAWIAERKDVLYTFFFLFSLIYYLRYKETARVSDYVIAIVFFVLSLLSKSAAVALAPVLFILDYFLQRKWDARAFYEKIPFLALSVAFGLLALASQGKAMEEDFAPQFPILQRLLIVCYNFDYYLLSFFVPFKLSPLHPYPVMPGSPLPLLFSLSPLLPLLLIIGIYFAKDYRRLLISGLTFFLLSMVMVIQLIPVGRAIVAERYTYVPYIGLSIIVVAFALKWMRSKSQMTDFLRVAPLLIIIFSLFVFAGISNARTRVWKDSDSLFSDIIKKYPGDAWAYYNRGLTRFYKQDMDGAIEDYSKSLSLKPDNTVAWFNRSLAYANKQDFQRVIKDLDKALTLKPDYVDALKNRGNAKAGLKDFPGSVEDFTKALSINPADTGILVNRSISFYNLQELDKACSDLAEARRLGSVRAVGIQAEICRK